MSKCSSVNLHSKQKNRAFNFNTCFFELFCSVTLKIGHSHSNQNECGNHDRSYHAEFEELALGQIRLDNFLVPIQCTDNLGCFPPGKASSHSTVLPSFSLSLCAVFSCFHTPAVRPTLLQQIMNWIWDL